MPSAKSIKVSEFLELRIANSNAIVIDVRDDEKWGEGHIPGATHIHKSIIENEIGSIVPNKNAEIFCHCGGGQSGNRAAEALAKLGYKNVSSIEGGFRSYKATGAPIDK